MKKIFTIVLMLLLAFSIVGCSTDTTDNSNVGNAEQNKQEENNVENENNSPKEFSWQKSNTIKLFYCPDLLDSSTKKEVEVTYHISPFIKYDDESTLAKAWDDISKMDSKFTATNLDVSLESYRDVSKINNTENLIAGGNGGYWRNSGGYAYAFIFAEYKNVSNNITFSEQSPYESNDGFHAVIFREGNYEKEELDIFVGKTLQAMALRFEVCSDGEIRELEYGSLKLTENVSTRLYLVVIPEWVSKEHPNGNENTKDLGAQFHSDTGYEEDQCVVFGKTY